MDRNPLQGVRIQWRKLRSNGSLPRVQIMDNGDDTTKMTDSALRNAENLTLEELQRLKIIHKKETLER